MERFSKLAAHALERSLRLAEELGHSYFGSEHLLLGLAKEADGVAARVLLSGGCTPDKLKAAIRRQVGVGSPTLLSIHDMTPRLEAVLTAAGQMARRYGFSAVGTDHLLAALCEEPRSQGCRLLIEQGVDIKKMLQQLRERMGSPDLPLQGEKTKGRLGKQAQKFTTELTAEAALRRADPLIGREEELERLMSILMRKNKNNPCLVGPPGVGKTVMVEGLARAIVEGRVPAALRDLRIHLLDLTAMIAGTKYRGEFEERLRGLLEEAERDPDMVLFIDELHILVGAGAAEGAIDAANILKPALARGKVKVIGATTAEEYRKYIEKDGALERRFAPVWIEEPSAEQALEILEGLCPSLEAHHRLEIPKETLEAAVRLSVRYMGDRYLPDKAIDLLDEAAGRARLRAFTAGDLDRNGRIRQKQMELDRFLQERQFAKALAAREAIEQLQALSGEEPPIGRLLPEDITALVADKTGIPLRADDPEGKALYQNLAARLGKRLIGQQPAVDALCGALLRSRAGLSDPNRPACALLFCGPTGVGKTRLARLLAEELFGKSEALIKYDMAEYMEPHSVSRLIGAPPGYIGFEKGGGLVARLRERPYAVVLFDEIEKAHPDVLNLLLGILDEGRLTDGLGKTADFRNATVILTSNLGSERWKEEPLGFGQSNEADLQRTVRQAVTKALRPEFINRLDEVVAFAPLDQAALEQIAALQLEELRLRLEGQGLSVRFDGGLAAEAVRRGYDKKYGARAVRRWIEREIGGALARRLLEGDRPEGVLGSEQLLAIDFAGKIS